MRIKRLELVGFKSSKDRTLLDFPAGVTGIVGPNGCGKSNIVDALRWVLGEQSARHLRGRSMEDVIFAGNERHGPLGMAEVTITLDNEAPPELDAEARSELAEEESEIVRALRRSPELQVTRRLFRSGESEYLINGRTCRLRDITELFLGTGVGTKAYSIVEQGRVGQIVGAKPDELRVFIEEAAGTTLYRSRKLAAERKIERTRENLLRVSDIVRELERQASSLRRQAKGAMQFQELRAQEFELDRQWCANRLATLAGELASAQSQVAERRGREHALRERVGESQGARDSLEDRLGALEEERGARGKAVFSARGALTEAEQERRHLEARKVDLATSISETERELVRLHKRLEELSTEEAAAAERQQELTSEYHRACQDSESLAQHVRQFDETYFEWSGRADAVRSELIQALGGSAALRNEHASITRQIETAQGRESRLRSELDALRIVSERLRVDQAAVASRLDDLGRQLSDGEASKAAAAGQLQQAESQRVAAQEHWERLREECATLRSKLESLEELHGSFAGYGEGVRAFMANGGREQSGAIAVLADLIDIEPGYEKAVAAVLGPRLQRIVVPTTDSGLLGVAYLRDRGAGRATFAPVAGAEKSASVDADGQSSLASRVSIRPGFESLVGPLLSECVVASDLEEARREWSRSAGDRAVVTTDGVYVDRLGVVSGGSESVIDEAPLVRQNEIRKVRSLLEAAIAQTTVAQEAARAASTDAAECEARLAAFDRELHALAMERVRWSGEKRLHEQNSARTEERARAVAAELSLVEREIAAARDRLRECADALDASEQNVARLESSRVALEETGKTIEAERRARLADLEQARVREADARSRIEAAQATRESVALSRAEFDASRADQLLRGDRLRHELEKVGHQLADPALDSRALRARLEQCEASLAEVEEESRDARRKVEEVRREIDSLGSRIDQVRGELSEWELRRHRLELEKASVVDGARERLGIGEQELAETPATSRLGSELAAELEAVRSRIRRLGTVNLGAVAELEEIEGRLAELCGQRDDLERSIEDLRGTITRLNRLSKQRFEETFRAVDEIFRRTFPKLFHGGRASLALTMPENLLETGVEIFVQPPGKRLGNLDLLSGGEKALTAISLIFALFLHKPSPFCVLDEVDAPLDEANIGRFAKMVADMCDRSQFLLITHNKRTMEICDTLYGVTMSEPGVTRMVSVDLSQAA